jgi:hypothetical protein
VIRLQLVPGRYVLDVSAYWSSGDVSYGFLIDVPAAGWLALPVLLSRR